MGSEAEGIGGSVRIDVRAPKISLTDLHQHFAEGWRERLVPLPSLSTLPAV